MDLHFSPITAATKDNQEEDMQEIVGDKLALLEDDFDYAIAGIEKLCRDGRCSEALTIIDTISASVESFISQIGDDFSEGPIEE